jgi:hypothetical protein
LKTRQTDGESAMRAPQAFGPIDVSVSFLNAERDFTAAAA